MISFTHVGTPLEVFHVTPGRRYRFRVIQATGNHCPTELSIDGHELIVIASDGFPVEPFTVGTLGMTSAERYDFVLNADKNPGNYRIHVRGMSDPCDGIFGQGKTRSHDSMKVEITLPSQKGARILQFTKDESLASFQWCSLRIAHNYPLLLTTKQMLI